MIGLILGTSEGKEILKKLNEFTEDIFVTTATAYGGELLKDYKYKYINSSPLSKDELKELLIKYGVTTLVDATHPYAVEITANTRSICNEINIQYIRYERPSIVEKYSNNENIRLIDTLEQMKSEIIKSKIKGTILNTTGSRNVEKFIALELPNRIVHRVLPTVESVEKCLGSGIRVEDVIAVKGPIGFELDCAFIKEYKAEAIVLKDSGTAGGTEEKLRAAIDQNIVAFVLKRKNEDKGIEVYKDIGRLVECIIKVLSERSK